MELAKFVVDFARALSAAGARPPTAVNQRSGISFIPGIGPHGEVQTIDLAMRELAAEPSYARYHVGVPYPNQARQKCDLCISDPAAWEWAAEVKMLRFLGDNGQVNDNILMHILPPYAQHRSALTDCAKLLNSGLAGRKAVLLYGFEHSDWPLLPAIEAFEVLASQFVKLVARETATFGGLVHPVNDHGTVLARELIPPSQ